MKSGGAYDGFEGRQWQVEGEILPYLCTERTLNETAGSSSAMVGVRMSTCQRVGMDWLQVGHPPVQQEASRRIIL